MPPFAARFAKVSAKLRELRILFCQTGKESYGAREYVENFYPSLRKANPHLRILIRECSGIQPRLFARFEMGEETSIILTNKSAEDIRKEVDAVCKKYESEEKLPQAKRTNLKVPAYNK